MLTAKNRETANPQKISMEPLLGIEPRTYSLRVNCSTPELQRRNCVLLRAFVVGTFEISRAPSTGFF